MPHPHRGRRRPRQERPLSGPPLDLPPSFPLPPSSPPPPPDTLPSLTSLPTYEDFFRDYIVSNVPVVIRASAGLLSEWACRSRGSWGDAGSDWSSLRGVVEPDHEVPVSLCGQRYFNSQECESWTFGRYMDYFEEYRRKGYPAEMECVYLRDWHLRREVPEYDFYQTPPLFCSDWLNELWLSKDSNTDYRFLYLGPRGSWTPFHSDVFGSFSWSANIRGRKRWIFVAKGHEDCFRDKFGKLIYDMRTLERFGGDVTEETYPRQYEATVFDFIQEPGDTVFVPSRWFHQVHNEEDAVSVNHNWFNGANIGLVWRTLVVERGKVEKEIDDCKATSTEDEWFRMCEDLLRLNHGTNLTAFLQLLDLIKTRRLHALASSDDDDEQLGFDGRRFGPGKLSFDVRAVDAVLEEMSGNETIQGNKEMFAKVEELKALKS